MESKELIERLVDDLESIIKSRSISRSVEDLRHQNYLFVKTGKVDYRYTLEEFFIASKYDLEMSAEIKYIIQFINLKDEVIDIVRKGNAEPVLFLRELKLNKEKAIQAIEHLKSENSKVICDSESFGSVIDLAIQKLDHIHRQAIIFTQACEKVKDDRNL